MQVPTSVATVWRKACEQSMASTSIDDSDGVADLGLGFIRMLAPTPVRYGFSVSHFRGIHRTFSSSMHGGPLSLIIQGVSSSREVRLTVQGEIHPMPCALRYAMPDCRPIPFLLQTKSECHFILLRSLPGSDAAGIPGHYRMNEIPRNPSTTTAALSFKLDKEGDEPSAIREWSHECFQCRF